MLCRNILWNIRGILIGYKSSLAQRSSSRKILDPHILQKCNGSTHNPGVTMTLYYAIKSNSPVLTASFDKQYHLMSIFHCCLPDGNSFLIAPLKLSQLLSVHNF